MSGALAPIKLADAPQRLRYHCIANIQGSLDMAACLHMSYRRTGCG